MKHSSGPFRLVHKLNARGDVVCAADIYSGSTRIGAATIRDELPWQGNGKLFAMSAEMHKALRIIRTWASVPGALEAENVLNLINPVLAQEDDEPPHE